MKQEHTREASEVLLPEYYDVAMGFPVILRESVIEVRRPDGEKGIIIPDLAGLEAAMAVARVSVPAKLTGPEIKFLRKAMALKAAALAKFLDVTAETLSRWENGREPISTNAERLLRLRVLNTLRDRAPGVVVTAGDVLELKFLPVRLAHETALVFERVLVLSGSEIKEAWFFKGVNRDQAAVRQKHIA